MKIEQKIKEVNDYFVEKIKNDLFEVKEISNCVITISVDGKIFSLWISNGEDYFSCYNGSPNFIELVFTRKDKKILHDKFRKIYIEYNRTIAIEKLEKELIELKSIK